MKPKRAALLVLRDRLDHRTENVGIDPCPVERADMKQVGARDPREPRNLDRAGEKAAVDVRKGMVSAQRGQFHAARPSVFVLMARKIVEMTSCVLDKSLPVIWAIVSLNRLSPWKMSVFSAKKQKMSRAIKSYHFMAGRRADPQSGLCFSNST